MAAMNLWRSLGTKIFFVFVLFVSAFVSVVGGMGYRTAQSAIIRQAEANFLQTIVQAGDKLDIQLRYYQELANQLIRNSEFTESLFQFAYPDLPFEERERRIASASKLFDQLALSDEHIRDISLFALEDPVPTITTNREVQNGKPDEGLVEQIRQAEGRPVWFPVADSYFGPQTKEVFAFGQLLGRTNLGSHDYVLFVQIDAAVLHNALQGIRLGDRSVIALTDRSGQPFAIHADPEEEGRALRFSVTEQGQGVRIQEGAHGKEIVVYRTSDLSGWMLAGKVSQQELTADARNIQTVTLSAIGASVGVAIGIGALLAARIGRRLGRLKTLMEEAAAGNFSGRLHQRGKDEIGLVSAAYDQMASQVGSLIHQIRVLVKEVTEAGRSVSESAHRTAHSAKEILTASEQVAVSSVDLATNAEHSNNKAGEMKERLQETYLMQQNMSQSAKEVHSVCYTGNGKVQTLLKRTDDTRACFVKVGERLNRLEQRMESIHELLDLLTQMGEQTTILSLNASIEAARLGNAKSGFHAIAEEIRKLADHSNRSIREIGEILESIQAEVGVAVLAMEQTMPAFQELSANVRDVHDLFAEIQTQMERLLHLAQEVAAAVETMQETQRELSKSSEEVSVVAEEASAASQQVASLCHEQQKVSDAMVVLAENMREQADKLNQYLSQFKI